MHVKYLATSILLAFFGGVNQNNAPPPPSERPFLQNERDKPFVMKAKLVNIHGKEPALFASGILTSPDSRLNLPFQSGGFGRGYLPAGVYHVTIHRLNRNDSGFVRDNVGFSFALENKFDPRIRSVRSLLRIHPGSGRGSHGCVALDAEAKLLSDFRDELAQHCREGRVELHISIPNAP
jgi:hypothetical protein